jgi:hypothetical protein
LIQDRLVFVGIEIPIKPVIPAKAAVMFTHVATAKGDGIWFKSLNNLVIPAKAGTHGATYSPLTVCGPMGPGFRRDDGPERERPSITTALGSLARGETLPSEPCMV